MSLSRNLATLIITERVTLSQVVDVLTKYKMLSLLPSVKQALIQVSSQSDTRDIIMIESPFPLSDDALKKVKQIVGDGAAHHEVVINKNILAGFKARHKGILYDGSAERIIKQLLGNH
jgi:F0F1-type ATP synthase delta subunit